MKIKFKIFSGILFFMTAACAFPAGAENYYDTIDYIECGDNVVVTGFEGKGDTVSVPGTINGKNVVEIRENAFYKCDGLKKIIIPRTVKKIGHHAFYECKALERVEIYADISELKEGSFYECGALTDVILPDSLRFIDEYCFYGCENLENIRLPESLEEIGKYAFAECDALCDIQLPENLMSIDSFAFYECDSLENINIPDSVINMENYSVGYEGKIPELKKEFFISGNDDSLGSFYAEINQIKFKNINDNEHESENNVSGVPAAIAIASAAGLMFFRILENMKNFRIKYEYEC